MLQSSIFEKNSASIRVHEKAGFRFVGVREKNAQRDRSCYEINISVSLSMEQYILLNFK